MMMTAQRCNNEKCSVLISVEIHTCDKPLNESIHENSQPSSWLLPYNMNKSIPYCCFQCTPMYLIFKKEQRTGSSPSTRDFSSAAVSQYPFLSPASI